MKVTKISGLTSMKHGYGIFAKVPVLGTAGVRVRLGYAGVRLGTYLFFFFFYIIEYAAGYG